MKTQMKLDGTPVKDAKKDVTVNISTRDCRRGSAKDPSKCAAALACRRELSATDTRIHVGRCYLKIAGKWLRYRPAQALRSEIIAFDRGGEFKPGQYLLRTIPLDCTKRTKRAAAKSGKGNGVKGKKNRRHHVVAGIREPAPRGPSAGA